LHSQSVEGTIVDGESSDRESDEVMCARWVESGGEWTGWGWRNDEGIWFQMLLQLREHYALALDHAVSPWDRQPRPLRVPARQDIGTIVPQNVSTHARRSLRPVRHRWKFRVVRRRQRH